MASNLSSFIDTAAVACVIKEKAAKEAKAGLKVGTHGVDVTVRIRGTVTKGEDFEQAVTASIPWQRIALALFDKMARQIGPKAVREAIESFKDGETVEEFVEELNAAGNMLAEAMTLGCTKMVNGKVTTALTIIELDPAELAKAVAA